MSVDGLIQSMKKLSPEGLKTAQAINKTSSDVNKLAPAFDTAAASLSTMTTKARAAELGMKALKIAGNMAAGFIAGVVLNFAIEQITHLVNAQKEAIEKANEISSAWKSQNEVLASNKKAIDDISSDYELLSRGVNQFGQNISLTSEEYSKYNDIVNQIADMFPTMVQGYTDEGNAILANKGNVEALTKAYEEQKKATQDAILVGSEGAWKGFSANFNTNKWLPYNQSTLKAQISEAKKLIDQVTNKDFSMSSMHGNGETKLNFSEMIKSVGLREIGVFESYGDYQKYLSDNINTIVAGYNTLNQKAQTATTAIKPILSTLLDDDNNFQGLTEKMQGNLKGIFSKFDFNFFSQFDTKDAMYSWVSENFILPLTDPKTAAETQSAFASLFSLDKTTMPYGEWKAQAELLINTIADALGLTGDDRKDFIINLGFKTDELDPYVNELIQQFSISEDTAKKLKTEMKEAADEYNKLTNGNVDYNKRPVKTPEEMLKYGYDIGDVDGATILTSGYGFLRDKVEFEVEITPILDNGDVLTEEKLNNYFDKICDSAKTSLDVINNDKPENGGLGLVVHIGKDPEEVAQLEHDLEKVKDKHLNAWMKLNQDDHTKEQIRLLTDEEIRLSYTIENKGNMTFDELITAIERTKAEETLAQFDVSTLTSGIDALKASSEAIAKAYAEMNSESGELSLDTAKELITLDKDYLALLDTKNGKITIGTDILEQQFEIEKKKQTVSLETEKAKLIASQAAIKSAIDSANAEILAMSAVYNMSDSIYRDAMAKLGKSKSDLAENEKSIVDVDKALSVLNTISLGDFASGQKSAKSATDALTASLNKQKKALDEQKAALDKQKAKQDSALRAVNKLLDDEIKKLEEQKAILADPEVAGSYGQRIKAIQDEMDALNAANDAREQAINLEKAQAEAERANSQKVHRIYREGIGFVWNTDQDAIAEANDKLEKIKLDKQLADLEAAKKKLQDTLAAEQKALDDNIKKLQGYKEKWGEVASAYQDAQDRIAAAQQLGADWESKVLNGRLDALEGFKTKYLAIQDELARKAEEIEAINKRIADAQNNSNGGGNGGSGNGNNGNGNGNNGATGGKLTYEDWLANNPEPKAPPRGSGSYQWYLDSPEYKQYKASLYAWESSKHFAGFKNGTMCSPEGYANLHEEGSELVIPPPVNGHIEYLKYGTKVLPFDLSQKLMDMALDNPIMPDMRSLTMPDLQLSPIVNNSGQEIHDINMNINMSGVNDCEEMAKIINRNFKGILKQSFNKS